MRILRLAAEGRRVVDLHPALSVLVVDDPEERARLRRAVAAVAVGLAPDGGGLLEAHGILFDASRADVDLLDLADDPVGGVATAATLAPDRAAGERGDRLRSAERDVLLLATDRRSAVAAERAASVAGGHDDGALARAEHLRLALALHEETDVEPLRRALDLDRDARRDGPAGAIAPVVEALAALGLDLRRHDVDHDEVRRTATDLLDEHRRHAEWAIGARVELAGLERRVLASLDAPEPARPVLPESVERRVERATATLVDALARADARRDELVGDGWPEVGEDELEHAVREAVTRRARPHVAGSAPLLLDRVLGGRSDAAVERVLDALAPLARTVQLIVLDDHPAAVRWAIEAGPRRAAVVRPTPAPRSEASPTMPSTTM